MDNIGWLETADEPNLKFPGKGAAKMVGSIRSTMRSFNNLALQWKWNVAFLTHSGRHTCENTEAKFKLNPALGKWPLNPCTPLVDCHLLVVMSRSVFEANTSTQQ